MSYIKDYMEQNACDIFKKIKPYLKGLSNLEYLMIIAMVERDMELNSLENKRESH